MSPKVKKLALKTFIDNNDIMNQENQISNSPLNEYMGPTAKPYFSKKILLIISAISTILLVSIGSVFIFFNRKANTPQLENSVNEIPQLTVIPSENDKANIDNWNIYSNSSLGISFMYPQDILKIINDGDFRAVFIPVDAESLVKYDYNLHFSADRGIFDLHIDDFTLLTLENYINNIQKVGNIHITDKIPVTFGGYPGYKSYTEKISPETSEVLFYSIKTQIKILDFIYELVLNSKDKETLIKMSDIYDKITETFKFTSITPTIAPPESQDVVYCCQISYSCQNKSVKTGYVKNHQVYIIKAKGSSCVAIGKGVPDTNAYSDGKCTVLLDTYIDYCEEKL